MPELPGVVRSAYRGLRRRLGVVRRRLGAALLGSSVASPASIASVGQPAAPTDPGPTLTTWREPPLPGGWSTEELQRAMSSFSIDGSPPGSLDGYWQEAFGRFLHTWGLVKDLGGSALELGANPYFLTWLLTRFTPLELSLANFFGDQRGTITQQLEVVERGTAHELAMTSELFNMEEDPFPYGDDAFDVVLFCEIIEHLLMDPLHALREIHRILRPGGTLVLTTPNGVRMENVLAVLAGTNVNDPYSGFGPYGRHNREYVRGDLVRLLEFAGFSVEACFSADSHRIDVAGRPEYHTAAPALVERAEDLGQYFFIKAAADRPGRTGLPKFLYRSWPEDQLVD